MSFLSPSSTEPEPSRLAVLKALDRFIERPVPAILESKQNLLLTDTADQILTERINRVEASSAPQEVITLKFYRWFLRRARLQEVAVACEELRYLTFPEYRQIFLPLLKNIAHLKTLREERSMLEQRLDLLDPDLDKVLEVYIAWIQQNPDQIGATRGKKSATDLRDEQQARDDLRLLLEVLRDARKRGGTAASVREAYVNFYGGRGLDVPSWFLEEDEKLFDLANQEQTRQTGDEQIKILRNLIQCSQKDTQVALETLAELRLQLAEGLLYLNLHKRDQGVYEEAIQLLEATLQVYTHERYPYRFALAQKRLGDAYLRRAKRGRKQNLEAAIRCYTDTLHLVAKEISPQPWAETQVSLAYAYRERIEGSMSENVERAIQAGEAALQIFTRQDFPTDWASAQQALANAYCFRVEGTKSENLEQAIEHYYSALQGITREDNAHAWGICHYSLGNSYSDRIEGSHKDNLEQAIAHYNAALQVLTRNDFPLDWALIQGGLGGAYLSRSEGSQKDNIESAITYFKSALEIFTSEASPQEWAGFHNNIGSAYARRIEGAHNENLEQAIAHYTEAERTCSRESDPYQWATIQFNLGNTYSDRLEGKRRDNLRRAISCYEATLKVWGQTTFPYEWARAQSHLGTVYNTMQDEERAIVYYKETLHYFTRENHPYEWSGLQRNLGIAYRDLAAGDRHENIQRAINHLQAAQEVQTRRAYPAEWAGLQEALGTTYLQRTDQERLDNLQSAFSCYEAALQVYKDNGDLSSQRSALIRVGNIEAEREHWEAAHKYFAEASDAENTLSLLGAGAMGRDLIRGETTHASTRVGYALVRLNQYEQAVSALEQGQAQDLAEGLRLDADHPESIKNAERRKHYEEAKDQLISALRSLNMLSNEPTLSGQRPLDEEEQRQQNLKYAEAYHQALDHFNAVVDEIRAAQDPEDFLQDTVKASTILDIAKQISPQHALVYLVATPWGGFALAALGTGQHPEQASRFIIDLPQLTEQLIADLIVARLHDGTNTHIGGYAYAQQNQAFALFSNWFQQGKTFHEAARLLHEQCALYKQESALDRTAQEILTIPELAPFVNIPLDTTVKKVPEISNLVHQFESIFLHNELHRCFETLSALALSPLIAALQEHDVAGLTLIPCGWLAAFPLTAVPLANGRTVGDTMSTSVAPSARSLRQEMKDDIKRDGVYALGDPRPVPEGMELKWGEAEAQTVRKIARLLQLNGGLSVQEHATREKLIKALKTGLVVDVSCHGAFDNEDFRRSSLLLAMHTRLSLGELLSHEVDLRGMRLLILSACQTAVLDLNGAVNEVRSLAAGVLQSGAQAVLASLWPVDDYATYLLIVYFARQWLPNMKDISPAEALTNAQLWLRNGTWGEIQAEMQQWNTVPVTVRKNRLEYTDALETARHNAMQSPPELRPFASPVYWAGFQVTGW